MRFAFLKVTKENFGPFTTYLAVIGVLVGLIAGAQVTSDWRNTVFGPICGALFYGALACYLGALLDKGMRHLAKLFPRRTH